MRVLQVIQYFDTGGLEQMVLTLARGIERAGAQCHVLAYLCDGALREQFRDAGIKTFFCGRSGGFRWELPWIIHQRLGAGSYDVLHTHHVGPLLYGAGPAALKGVPHVHTEHSLEFYDTPRRRALARLLSARAHFVGVTGQIAQWHERVLGTRLEVIENGVTLPPLDGGEARQHARKKLSIPDDAFVVGCVARLAPEKHLTTLLEAFAQVAASKDNSRLIVVGDGPDRSRLGARAAALGIDQRVQWLGNRDDVASVLFSFDVIALSSVREGLPLSVLEGMARMLPVVATAVGGLPLLLENGGGRLVPPRDADQMAAALLFYDEHPERRADDGIIARTLVETKYTDEKMVKRYMSLYSRAQSKGGSCEWTGSSLGTILGRTHRPPSIWR